jgi:transcriptional regulator with XRE-family HTH domain
VNADETKVAKQLGLGIKLQRIRLGLTQEEAAGRAGFERSFWSNCETGKRNLQLTTLIKIALALDCAIGELFVEVSPPKKRPRANRS